MRQFDDLPVATILLALAFLVVVVVGGLVTILNPDALEFEKYITLVTAFAAAVGLLGVGRGIRKQNLPRKRDQ